MFIYLKINIITSKKIPFLYLRDLETKKFLFNTECIPVNTCYFIKSKNKSIQVFRSIVCNSLEWRPVIPLVQSTET